MTNSPHTVLASWDGQTVLAHDVFFSHHAGCVCLIAPGDPAIGFDGIQCVFEGKETVAGRLLSGKDDEDCHVRTSIVLFPVPPHFADKEEARVTIQSSSRVFYDDLPLSLSSARRQAREKKLVAVLLFKDEQPFLAQWIDYHLLLGVEHFYLYDNKSEDRPAVLDILRPYLDRGVVTHIGWDFPYKYAELNATFTQAGAVNHWLLKYGHLARWMTHIDVDEYIHPVDGRVDALLRLIDQHDAGSTTGSLVLRWCWFGNSGFRRMPPGRVIENFVWRQPLHYGAELKKNQNKLLVRTDAVEILNYHYVTLHKKGFRTEGVDPGQLRLNHYAAITYRGRIKKPRHNDEKDLGMQLFVPLLEAQNSGLAVDKVDGVTRWRAEIRRFASHHTRWIPDLARRGKNSTRDILRRLKVVR